MSATKRVTPFESWPAKTAAETRNLAPGSQPVPDAPRLPALHLAPLLVPAQPRRFVRVPTHAVGVHPEHREYPRATLNLPLRLRNTGGVPEEFPITLVTRDISSTGVYFLCPKQLAVGASIELEIVLVSRPLGLGMASPQPSMMLSLTATIACRPVFSNRKSHTPIQIQTNSRDCSRHPSQTLRNSTFTNFLLL